MFYILFLYKKVSLYFRIFLQCKAKDLHVAVVVETNFRKLHKQLFSTDATEKSFKCIDKVQSWNGTQHKIWGNLYKRLNSLNLILYHNITNVIEANIHMYNCMIV